MFTVIAKLFYFWFHTEAPDAAAPQATDDNFDGVMHRRSLQRRAVKLWAEGQTTPGYHLPDEWN